MRFIRTGAVALAVVATAVASAGAASAAPWNDGSDGWSPGHGRANGTVAVATVDLSEEEIAGAVFTREEEQMAHDLYERFADLYPEAEIFSRIAASEQRHIDAMVNVLEAYDIDDPSTGEPGVYTDADVQAMYDEWLTDGSASVEDAYQVGIELEAVDIEDLESLIAEADNPMLDRVYSNLLNGSEHHLAAFEAAAAGETPAVCPQDGTGKRDGTGKQDRQMPGPGAGGRGHGQHR